MRVTAVDWAGMIPTTKRITEKFGVRDRFDFIEGDLSEANFGSGYDVATLGHILHSEGEQRSRQLLKKTFRALKSGGTIAIAEWLVNDDRTKPLPSLMFSVQMLVNTEKGDTFSFNEIKKWLEDAGFKKCGNSKRPGHHRSFWQQNRSSGVLRICFSSARRSVLIREMKKRKRSRAQNQRPGLPRETLSEMFPTVNRRFAAKHSSGL